MKKQLFLITITLGITAAPALQSVNFTPTPKFQKLLTEGGEKLQAFATFLAFLAQDAQITQESPTSIFAQNLDKPVILVIRAAFEKVHKPLIGNDIYNSAVEDLFFSQNVLELNNTKRDYLNFLNLRYQAALKALKPDYKTYWGTKQLTADKKGIPLPASIAE